VRSVTKNMLYSGAPCHRSVKYPHKCNFIDALKEHAAGSAPISATHNQWINVGASVVMGRVEINMAVQKLRLIPSIQRRGKRGRRKGEGTLFLNLFFCDVNVAAGGHVDLNPTHYYSRLQYGLSSITDKSAQSRTKFYLRP